MNYAIPNPRARAQSLPQATSDNAPRRVRDEEAAAVAYLQDLFGTADTHEGTVMHHANVGLPSSVATIPPQAVVPANVAANSTELRSLHVLTHPVVSIALFLISGVVLAAGIFGSVPSLVSGGAAGLFLFPASFAGQLIVNRKR